MELKTKILASLFFLSLYSCTIMNNKQQRNVFLSQFADNEVIYSSLSNNSSEKKIVIYDEKRIINENITFKNVGKIIEFTNIKPQDNDHYFIVHNFILNKNLATLVLVTNDRNYGIIYYLTRKGNNDKWKHINIIPRNTR